MTNAKIQEILDQYRYIVTNTHEALELAGVPKKLLYYYTFVWPDLNEVLPEDIVKFFDELRVQVIIYLRKMGFSQREIARRLKGGSYFIVNQVLQEYEKTKLADPKEVKVKGSEANG